MKLSVLDQSPIIGDHTAAGAIAATLEALFPGRLDLGIGRAPRGDLKTARAVSGRTTGGQYDGAERFAALAELFSANEVVVLSVAPDYGVRLKSYELLSRTIPPAG